MDKLIINIDEKLKKALKQYALDNDTDMSRVVLDEIKKIVTKSK